MAAFDPVKGSTALIYVDEFNMSAQSSGAQMDAAVDTVTYSVMGEDAARSSPAASAFTLAHNGYFTGVDDVLHNGIEEVLYNRLGSTTPVVVTLILDTLVYTLNGTYGQQLNINAPVDGLITVEGNWASPDYVGRGIKLIAGSVASATPSAGVDLEPDRPTKAVIHVSGFADLTACAESVTVSLTTSATAGGAYVAWLSNVFKKPGAVVLSGTASNRWVKVTVTLTAGVSFPINVVAAPLS